MNAVRFARALRGLAKIRSQATSVIAARISQEIQKGFDLGRDPYGQKWQRLAKSTIAKGRRPPPLTDTGAGRRSIVVAPKSGAGIKISIGTKYMAYHQTGTRKMPRRAFLPVGDLPKSWVKIWEKAIVDLTKKRLRG